MNKCNKPLFAGGDHTRTRAVVTSRVGALSKFTSVKFSCLGCKSVLPDKQTFALCNHCQPDVPRLYQEELDKLRCV